MRIGIFKTAVAFKIRRLPGPQPSVDFNVQSEKLRCIKCGALLYRAEAVVRSCSTSCETLNGQRMVGGNHRVKTAIRR